MHCICEITEWTTNVTSVTRLIFINELESEKIFVCCIFFERFVWIYSGLNEDYGICKDFVAVRWHFVMLMFYKVSCEHVAAGLGFFHYTTELCKYRWNYKLTCCIQNQKSCSMEFNNVNLSRKHTSFYVCLIVYMILTLWVTVSNTINVIKNELFINY